MRFRVIRGWDADFVVQRSMYDLLGPRGAFCMGTARPRCLLHNMTTWTLCVFLPKPTKVRRGSQVPPEAESNHGERRVCRRPKNENPCACGRETRTSCHVGPTQLKEPGSIIMWTVFCFLVFFGLGTSYVINAERQEVVMFVVSPPPIQELRSCREQADSPARRRARAMDETAVSGSWLRP